MAENRLKQKTGRKTVTEQQQIFCDAIVLEKMSIEEAYLKAYPKSRNYKPTQIRALYNKLQNSPNVQKRIEEMYAEIRGNLTIEELYSFEKGVKSLIKQKERVEERLEHGEFSGELHKILLTTIQELNKMFGFNLVGRDGKWGSNVNINFVNVPEPEKDIIKITMD